MITEITTTTAIPAAPDTLASLALDPRRYWLRANRHATACCRRLSAAYERAWKAGQPAWNEWEQLREANRRKRFCSMQLYRVMDWR